LYSFESDAFSIDAGATNGRPLFFRLHQLKLALSTNVLGFVPSKTDNYLRPTKAVNISVITN
jgi:hypothetical protein